MGWTKNFRKPDRGEYTKAWMIPETEEFKAYIDKI